MITARESADGAYLPARMLNEFVYCPRLFYLEHVEGVFAHNRETVEGAAIHAVVDEKTDSFPEPGVLVDSTKPQKARSVQLASDRHGVIAKLDMVESRDGKVVPIDYKRGRPRELADGSLAMWDADRTQMAVQAIILRDLGYQCDEAIVWYHTTRQRVRLPITDELVAEIEEVIAKARSLATEGKIPPPLDSSPKCPRCSLVGICLPDETRTCHDRGATEEGVVEGGKRISIDDRPGPGTIRRLVPARDEKRPLYLNTPGLHVGRSGQVFQVWEAKVKVDEVRLIDVSQINVFGNVQLSTQALQTACEQEIPIAYFSLGGWFYGMTQGLGLTNIVTRREQFRAADRADFSLRFAKGLIAGKIRNQATLLRRNHAEPPAAALSQLKALQGEAMAAESQASLLGIEGNAAAIYFANFQGMIKLRPRVIDTPWGEFDLDVAKAEEWREQEKQRLGIDVDPDHDPMEFQFKTRNRRPPRDPINALLSLGYALLAKDLMITCGVVGFDPYLGFYHQPRYGRASLALDLMEPFRPLIVDSVVLSAINTRMVTIEDFVRTGNAVALKPEGRKKFFTAYEQRMDTLVTHPLFGYRVSYRRILEIQTRLLARLLRGEIDDYPVFTTR